MKVDLFEGNQSLFGCIFLPVYFPSPSMLTCGDILPAAHI